MEKNSYLTKETASTPKILGLIILILFVFALGWHVGFNQAEQSSDTYRIEQEISRKTGSDKVDMQLFWDVWSLLAGKYVEPQALDYKEMIYGSIRGMVFSLNDPYTTFLTPKENKNFQSDMEGILEGIGAELTLRHGLITVVSPLKNSPAKLHSYDKFPYYISKSSGDVCHEMAITNPNVNFLILAGHVHCKGHLKPLKNLSMHTAQAIYGEPSVYNIFNW